ncbi:MAG: hypothetical protein ABL962_12645 [Fimbriimonadaceae bacterium]
MKLWKVWTSKWGLATVLCLFCAFLAFSLLLPRRERHNHGDTCLTNLKQIGTATAIYADDNGDKLPLSDWMDGLGPVVKNDRSFNCAWGGRDKRYGYAMESKMTGANWNATQEPEMQVVYFETNLRSRNLVTPWERTRIFRHKDGWGAVCYSDTHARRVPPPPAQAAE